jgi:hypothetical protein
VKNPQHHEPIAFDAILKHIGRVENLQHDLPIFFAAGNRMSEQRALGSTLAFSMISRATTFASAG